MAIYDLEEQEQLESLKAWWKQYGNMVLAALMLAALVIAAGQGWSLYQRKQAAAASGLYDTIQKAAEARDVKKLKDAAGMMLEQYPRTLYAPMSAMLAARSNIDSGDMKSARAQLQWVIDNGRDDGFRELARLRLASLLLDEKAYDEALKLADGKHTEAFNSRFADVRGDILMAQGKTPEARAAYVQALEKMDAKNASFKQYVQFKLDAIGGAPASSPATPADKSVEVKK